MRLRSKGVHHGLCGTRVLMYGVYEWVGFLFRILVTCRILSFNMSIVRNSLKCKVDTTA